MKKITIPVLLLFFGAAYKMKQNLGPNYSYESCLAITFFITILLGFVAANMVAALKWYIKYFG